MKKVCIQADRPLQFDFGFHNPFCLARVGPGFFMDLANRFLSYLIFVQALAHTNRFHQQQKYLFEDGEKLKKSLNCLTIFVTLKRYYRSGYTTKNFNCW